MPGYFHSQFGYVSGYGLNDTSGIYHVEYFRSGILEASCPVGRVCGVGEDWPEVTADRLEVVRSKIKKHFYEHGKTMREKVKQVVFLYRLQL